jgi:hypothetical protein
LPPPEQVTRGGLDDDLLEPVRIEDAHLDEPPRLAFGLGGDRERPGGELVTSDV